MPGTIPESSIVRVWQQGLTGRHDLVTEDGGPLRIIYPGRLNDDRGADLKDAVVMTQRGMVRGDVEVHVRSSSWWGHGHHLDPSYNRVVLHVVYQHDLVFPARLENGTLVPTLALQRFLPRANIRRSGARTRTGLPCTGRTGRQAAVAVGTVLDRAGDERFQGKTTAFKEQIYREGAGQALYMGIMAALGYSHNQEPMQELSRRMPLASLEALIKDIHTDDDCLALCQAGLRGAAGLLPSQRRGQLRSGSPADNWLERLEDIWQKSGEKPQMTEEDWRFFKVRPGNHPGRRIAAMSHLLVRYREEGLLHGLLSIFEATAEDDICSVEQAFYVGTSLCLPETEIGTALLGKERAAEIIINVLLPFIDALGEAESRPEAGERARRRYRLYPAAAGNSLERHMKRQFGLERGVVDTARRQQGLLHIFKKYCSQGGCGECPLKRKEKPIDIAVSPVIP